jgi:hypothetical protein
MSAWIVSQGHINAIINYWVEDNDNLKGLTPRFRTIVEDLREEKNRQLLGQILLNENIISVEHRYPEQNPEEPIEDDVDELRMRDRPWREGKLSTLPGDTQNIDDENLELTNLGGFVYDSEENKGISIGQFLNCLRCLSYQSCEHPEWEDSDAWWIINEMERRALHVVIDYDWVKDNVPGMAKRLYSRDPDDPRNADPFGGAGSAAVWGL